LSIAERMAVAFFLWIAMVTVAAWIIGEERKRKWFRQRNMAKSFLNRRGFVGEFIHFGYPCTQEGWAVFGGFMLVIVITGCIAIFL